MVEYILLIFFILDTDFFYVLIRVVSVRPTTTSYSERITDGGGDDCSTMRRRQVTVRPSGELCEAVERRQNKIEKIKIK